jgi:hypothetical protein
VSIRLPNRPLRLSREVATVGKPRTIAPNDAAQRLARAKQIGLGQIQPKASVRKSGGQSKAGGT